LGFQQPGEGVFELVLQIGSGDVYQHVIFVSDP
jgi:hypothetical protein